MPARGLFIAALMLLAAGTASAQYSTNDSQGSSSSNAPSSTIPSSTTPSLRTPSSTDKSSIWGALAFTADGSWATAWTKPSKGEAEGDVAVACAKFGRGECKVVSFSGEYCAALASYAGTTSRRRSRTHWKLSFSAGGASVHEAQNAAMERCNEDSRTRGRCQLRTTVCGDGR
jgi:uncharacterized protein DUF4189